MREHLILIKGRDMQSETWRNE